MNVGPTDVRGGDENNRNEETMPGGAAHDSHKSPGLPASTQGSDPDVGGGGTPTRPIEKIPQSEIIEAVRRVLARAFAMPSTDLTLAVARELGYQRTGVRIRAVIDRAVQQQLQEGALIDVGGNLRLVTPDS